MATPPAGLISQIYHAVPLRPIRTNQSEKNPGEGNWLSSVCSLLLHSMRGQAVVLKQLLDCRQGMLDKLAAADRRFKTSLASGGSAVHVGYACSRRGTEAGGLRRIDD